VTIAIGRTLEGGTPPSGSDATKSGDTPPTTGGGTAGPAAPATPSGGNDILERMRKKRQEELNK